MTATLAERPQRWSWSPDRRRAYSRFMTEVWAQRERKPIAVDPEKGLGYLDRGSARTFEESLARARDPRRRVRQETNWSKCRP
jgi:hypothetical protein